MGGMPGEGHRDETWADAHNERDRAGARRSLVSRGRVGGVVGRITLWQGAGAARQAADLSPPLGLGLEPRPMTLT
jgi:hypothetical protein